MIHVSLKSAKNGMKVGKPIFDTDGTLLLGKGVTLNNFLIQRLSDNGISNIFIHDEATEDVVLRENISGMVRGSTIRRLKELNKSLDDVKKEMTKQTHHVLMDTISSHRFKDTFGNHPAIEKICDSARQIVDEILSGEMVLGLNSIKTYDNYTFQHSIDVTVVAVMIGRKIGLPVKRLRELGSGCLLHDMGKIFIPDEITNKPGKLTPEEFRQMKEHPTIGYELIKDTPSLGVLAPHVAFQHHEKQDGTGYPRGLQGKNNISLDDDYRNIHLYGNISAVADVYDALSSDRPYRKAFSPDKVIKIMMEMNENHLNSEVLRRFITIAPVFPEGSTIRVTNGDYRNYIGVVKNLNKGHFDRPVIRLIYNNKTEPIDPVEINLIKNMEISIESFTL